MDDMVSVPVTNPSTFLKQQASLTQDKAAELTAQRNPTIPDKRAQHRQVRTQRDQSDAVIKTIKSPDADPPVKTKRPAKKDTSPLVARKLAQEWLEF